MHREGRANFVLTLVRLLLFSLMAGLLISLCAQTIGSHCGQAVTTDDDAKTVEDHGCPIGKSRGECA